MIEAQGKNELYATFRDFVQLIQSPWIEEDIETLIEHYKNSETPALDLNFVDPTHALIVEDVLTEINTWSCSICRNTLSTKESLRRHVLTKHIKQKVHQCEACDKSFVLSADLALHVKEQHGPDGVEVLLCMCGRKFTKRNSLLSHIRHFHHPAPHIRPACSVCHKVFNDAATVRVHETRVHGDKTVRCEYTGCGKLFSTVGLKNAHYRSALGTMRSMSLSAIFVEGTSALQATGTSTASHIQGCGNTLAQSVGCSSSQPRSSARIENVVTATLPLCPDGQHLGSSVRCYLK
ncbi:Zinc finger C2H2-type [Trinorchestia longiramus]|nr:Zinc finger C2H2-type [Trinorchestia longiramus]